MLGMWRRIINADMIKLDKMSVGERFLMDIYIGKDIAAKIEATETIRLTRNVTSQVRITSANMKPIPGITHAAPSKTPKVVATPLPPLKFRNMVQL